MPRPKNTDTRRRQIARALMQVMATNGYDGASMTEIARAAGLTPGLIHYHFDNKQEILLSVLRELVEEHDAGLAAELATAGASPLAQVGAFLDFHLATGKRANAEALACWIALTGEALRQPEVRQAFERAVKSFVERLEAIIREGVARGELFCDSPKSAASALVALVEGYYVVAATARSQIPHRSAAGAARKMAAGLLRPALPLGDEAAR
jgi:TetR/AcrR family transcriptional repressor of bet genes